LPFGVSEQLTLLTFNTSWRLRPVQTGFKSTHIAAPHFWHASCLCKRSERTARTYKSRRKKLPPLGAAGLAFNIVSEKRETLRADAKRLADGILKKLKKDQKNQTIHNCELVIDLRA
jgi:hypothetical protein